MRQRSAAQPCLMREMLRHTATTATSAFASMMNAGS
jgi:hypothetical protein